jgi:hypothetical protein
MTGVFRESKRLEWEARVERQAQSGLSVAKFCEQEAISQASFYQWKRKLASNSPGNGRGGSSDSGSGNSGSGAKLAATPSMTPSFVQLPIAPTAGQGWFELTTPEGLFIRVPAKNLAAVEMVLNSVHRHEVTGEPRC